MTLHLKTKITAVGPDVADLAEGGVLILFADGSPAELAEVSVLHRVEGEAATTAPAVGTAIKVGDVSATITAIGDKAWAKVLDIGHVVIKFNGATSTETPGEIAASEIDGAALTAALKEGTDIIIGA